MSSDPASYFFHYYYTAPTEPLDNAPPRVLAATARRLGIPLTDEPRGGEEIKVGEQYARMALDNFTRPADNSVGGFPSGKGAEH